MDTVAEQGEVGLSEADLVARFRAGDAMAFEELYRQNRRDVFVVCLHFLRDRQAAEDLCHDAFVRAYESFSQLRGDRFGAWAKRIAANLSLNELRRRGVRERLAPEVPRDASPTVDREVEAREQLHAAHEILDSLAPEQKRVFVLRHLGGLGHREIAARTGYTPDQVRSYLQNGRRNFHLRFSAKFGPQEAESHG